MSKLAGEKRLNSHLGLILTRVKLDMQAIKDFKGNDQLLKLSKTAFLCSRKVPANTVLKCYDWAIGQREAGKCVISGFHSQLEKDVLHYLLKGKQPIIIALARGLKQKIEPELQGAMDNGRLLIITPFEEKVKRVSEETSVIRNRLMIDLADEFVVGFASEGGKLASLLKSQPNEKLKYL